MTAAGLDRGQKAGLQGARSQGHPSPGLEPPRVPAGPSAVGFGVGGFPQRWGISRAPGARVVGVGCLRAPDQESGSKGQLTEKGGWGAGKGEEGGAGKEGLEVTWLIEHPQPQI